MNASQGLAASAGIRRANDDCTGGVGVEGHSLLTPRAAGGIPLGRTAKYARRVIDTAIVALIVVGCAAGTYAAGFVTWRLLRARR